MVTPIIIKLFATFGILAVVFIALAALQSTIFNNEKADRVFMGLGLILFTLSGLTGVVAMLVAVWS